jgi:hypothetical protein
MDDLTVLVKKYAKQAEDTVACSLSSDSLLSCAFLIVLNTSVIPSRTPKLALSAFRLRVRSWRCRLVSVSQFRSLRYVHKKTGCTYGDWGWRLLVVSKFKSWSKSNSPKFSAEAEDGCAVKAGWLFDAIAMKETCLQQKKM